MVGTGVSERPLRESWWPWWLWRCRALVWVGPDGEVVLGVGLALELGVPWSRQMRAAGRGSRVPVHPPQLDRAAAVVA